MLRELGLESFAKVAAAAGLHVYVPVGSGATYDDTRGFARAVAQTIAKQFPDREPIDWSVNDPSNPPVCPYSLLDEDELTVSAPVSWEEVEGGDALVFDPETTLRRIDEEGDLFAPVLALRQDLPKI
jgi:bifunctional non-homologous end joining protein LigD